MEVEKEFHLQYYGKQYRATYRVEGLVMYVASQYGSANGSLHEYEQIDLDRESPVPAVLLLRRILDSKLLGEDTRGEPN